MVRRKKEKPKAPKVGDQHEDHEADNKKNPHSFVFQRGHVGKNISQLVHDMRRVMEPFTATNLKARKSNVLQDFVNIAGTLNVSHFIVFTKTESANYMRLIRLPRGPTMTFKLEEYTLGRDVISSIKRHNMEQRQFKHHPLLVMNSFTGADRHIKLMATMFQNMFPSINVNKVKLGSIRRCVLLNYNAEDKTVDLRHYNIRAVPVGMSKGVKKLIKAKVPNMARFKDMSDYLLKPGELSESEAELDGDHNEVILPQNMSARGNIKASKSAIRLTEIGPRLTLKLVKIEEGVGEGEVLFHEFIQKTDAEKSVLNAKRNRKKKLKEQRKKQQEDNLKNKELKKKEHKKKSLAGMKEKEKEEEDDDVEDPGIDKPSSEDETDINYFRKEVGEEPEPELFPQRKTSLKRKRSDVPPSYHQKKKAKFDPHKKDKKEPNKHDKKHGKKFQKLKHDKPEAKDKKKEKKPLTEMDKILRRKQRTKKKLATKNKKPGGGNKKRPQRK